MDVRAKTDLPEAESILDPATLDKLRELGRRTGKDIFRRLVEVFLEQSRERIDTLRNASRQGDHQGVHEAVHSLKGTSGNLGALRLSRLCRQVEQRLRDGEALVEGFGAAVEEEYEHVVVELQALADIDEDGAETPEHVLAALRQIEAL